MNVAPSLGIFWVFYVGNAHKSDVVLGCHFSPGVSDDSSSKPSRENLPGKDTIEFFETFAWLKPPKGVGGKRWVGVAWDFSEVVGLIGLGIIGTKMKIQRSGRKLFLFQVTLWCDQSAKD